MSIYCVIFFFFFLKFIYGCDVEGSERVASVDMSCEKEVK